jgi:hypothetical protein
LSFAIRRNGCGANPWTTKASAWKTRCLTTGRILRRLANAPRCPFRAHFVRVFSLLVEVTRMLACWRSRSCSFPRKSFVLSMFLKAKRREIVCLLGNEPHQDSPCSNKPTANPIDGQVQDDFVSRFGGGASASNRRTAPPASAHRGDWFLISEFASPSLDAFDQDDFLACRAACVGEVFAVE